MPGQRGPQDQAELTDASRELYREKYVRFLIQPGGCARPGGASSELGAISPESSPAELFVPLSAKRILPPSDVLFFEDKGDRDEHDPQLWSNQRTSAHRQELTVYINNLLQELQDVRHMVILGGTGAGKTTLTRFLAHAFATGTGSKETGISEPLVPILVNLGRYSRTLKPDEELSFIDYVCATLADQHQDIPPAFFTWYLERGLCIVLLEGLNEVAGVYRPAVASHIERFARRYRNNRYLVTSQMTGYRSAPLNAHDFQHYILLDFDDAQIRASLSKQLALVYRVPDAVIEPRINAFMEYLKQHPGAKHLAANPLMLSMMAALPSSEVLPSQRAQLYERYTRLLAHHRDVVSIRRRLECIAWYLHTSPYEKTGEGEAGIDVLQQELSRYLRAGEKVADSDGEAHTFLTQMCSDAHILVDRGREHYGFVHRTFQNYYVACRLVPSNGKRLTDEQRAAVHTHIVDHLHQWHWEDVASLILARLTSEDATAIVHSILHEQHSWAETLLRRDLFFASTILIDGTDIARDVSRFIISELELVASDECYHQRRQDAIDALGALAASENQYYRSLALDTLSRLLTHAGIGVRQSAAEALGLVGDGHRKDQALAVLRTNLTHEFPTIRFDAIRGLYNAGDLDVAKRLLVELAQDATVYVEVRRNAAVVLWIWGWATESHRILVHLAEDMTYGRVAVEAAEALGQTGNMPEAARRLVSLAQTRGNSTVQWYAARALTNMAKRSRHVVDLLAKEAGYPRAFDSLDDDQVASVLVYLFRQQFDCMQKVMLADALGYFRHFLPNDVQERVLNSLQTWATGFPDWFVRVAAAQVLNTWDDTARAVTELLRLAENAANDDVREAATRVLGGMRQEDAVAPLVRLAGAAAGINVDIKHAAAESLGRLGYAHRHVLLRLCAMAEERADTFSGEAAYLALLKLRPPAQLPAL